MDAKGIMDAISNVGFPIVMCGGLIYYMVIKDRQHAEESKNMVSALNNNTLAIAELTKKLGE